MTTTLLTAGLVCIIAAIIGGGLTAFGIKMPIVQSAKRQAVLALFGFFLLGAAYQISREDKQPPNGTAQCETAPLLRLNEICAQGKECDGQKDFVELYNPNPSPVDLSCYALVDKKQHRHTLSGKLGPKDVGAWTRDDLGFGLDKDGDKVSLIRIRPGAGGRESVLDHRDIDPSRTYQQRIPDGGDQWEQMTIEEVGAAGSVGSRNGQNKTEKQKVQ